MTESGRLLRINNSKSTIENFLTTHGALPLPPYIEYSPEKEADYQTSFARRDGSVAAPTASLHFTSELMDRIQNPKEYLTLHVGLGTFKGIQTADIRDYDIHREQIEISLSIFQRIAQLKMDDQKIVAVGTTATRTLESLSYLWISLDQDIKNILDANTRKYWDILSQDIERQNWIHDITFNATLSTLHFSTSIYITP
jgi:S-adenosylmethionine:tRNA ribosyltransferase-isomerase